MEHLRYHGLVQNFAIKPNLLFYHNRHFHFLPINSDEIYLVLVRWVLQRVNNLSAGSKLRWSRDIQEPSIHALFEDHIFFLRFTETRRGFCKTYNLGDEKEKRRHRKQKRVQKVKIVSHSAVICHVTQRYSPNKEESSLTLSDGHKIHVGTPYSRAI